jgi:hypothetical protein
MPLGEVLGEVVGKVTSVRYSDLGGGQTKAEIDATGEAKGRAPGHVAGTFTVIRSGSDPARPAPWTYIGRSFLASGATASVSGQGLCVRTGEGHKIRFRGTMCGTTDDPKLAAELNNMIAAVEIEADPISRTITGANCAWK